jgi:hypothetical protein
LADAWCDVVSLPICRAFLETWTLFFSESSLLVYIYFKKRVKVPEKEKNFKK